MSVGDNHVADSDALPAGGNVLLIESFYGGVHGATDKLVLDFSRRTKSRLRARLASGAEVGLFLPRGTILRGGQKLLARDGTIVEVVAAQEELLEVTGADALELARAAYHLGNRHVPVELGEGWLRIQADHVLEAMLQGLGAEVTPLRGPFEPEPGAYGTGHRHEGEGTSGARIHLMGEE